MTEYTNILSIAGSDPMGCAGLQGDILTGRFCGVHVATAVTAVTVQNTRRFMQINAVKAETLRQQIEAVVTDIDIKAVKIGMLPSAELVETVAECISKYHLPNIVIDPIGAATVGGAESGERTSDINALHQLLPSATVITPNLREAASLLGEDISDIPPRQVAYLLSCRYEVPAVLVTGGDESGEIVRDAFYISPSREEGELVGRRIDSPNTHGTGCALSTAIAAYLAHGHTMAKAFALAEKAVHTLIESGKDYTFGRGNYGPLGYL